jgi:hypothetical protein
VKSDSAAETVTYALLDYRDMSALLGPLDKESFLAGDRDHQRWREGEHNPHAAVRVIERMRAIWRERAVS